MQRGQAQLLPQGSHLRLQLPPLADQSYHNAQLDDYQGRARRNFLWRPPVEMRLRARFSHPVGRLRGTAGFGFWNDPFLMTEARRPALPQAIWFFYASPPSNMKLDLDMPGFGWKAATVDAANPLFLSLAPLAPLAIPLLNLNPVYHLTWPIAQHALKVSEAWLPICSTDWHDYCLTWLTNQVLFWVDGQLVLQSPYSPRGPLGFVLWLDNQYLVLTPWGRFNSGVLGTDEIQWLDIAALSLGIPT